jgi:hypothetical protein
MSDRCHRQSALPPTTHPSNTASGPLASRLCAGLILLSIGTAQAATLTWDAEIGYTYDDNVTRAPRAVDILSDKFVAVSAGVSYLQWLNTNHRFLYRGFLRAEEYDKYNGLSNNSAGLQATYQYRASGEFTSPTYAVFFKSAIAEYDSKLRDSNLYSLGTSWRKPVTDRITFLTILTGNMRDSESTVFDTRDVSLLANIDYALGSRWTLYLTANDKLMRIALKTRGAVRK